MLGEELLELGDGVFHLRAVLVVDHDGEREFAEDSCLPSPSAVRAPPSSATAAAFESSTRLSWLPVFCRS